MYVNICFSSRMQRAPERTWPRDMIYSDCLMYMLSVEFHSSGTEYESL